MKKNTRNVEIDYCARCGMDHRTVVFYKFEGKPIASDGYDFEYWGWCPTFLEPLILRVDEDEELAESRTSEGETEKGKGCTLCGCTPKCEDSELSPDEAEPLPTD